MNAPLPSSQGLLVMPHLQVQNANAISSQMTHGFPSITAFTGLMWALERKLSAAGLPLHFLKVGVICHDHQEQVNNGFVKTFHLTRNPVEKDGSTAGIVEEGRTHLDLTLVFLVRQKGSTTDVAPLLVNANDDALDELAQQAWQTLSMMRVAGGSVLPPRPAPGRSIRPWLRVLLDEPVGRAAQFREWRRRWLPGFALVGRDDLIPTRLAVLRKERPDATTLDAWMDLSRFNYRAEPVEDGAKPDSRVRWSDPQRGKGSGWIVPIPVGYAGLSDLHKGGQVRNTRDVDTPLRFVESVYSMGEWISPHRLEQVDALLWHAETDNARALYRCRNNYVPAAEADEATGDDFYAYD